MPKFNMNVYKKREITPEQDFAGNKELRRNILTSMLPFLKQEGIEYTDEDVERIISDEEKLKSFKKANAHRENTIMRKKIYHELKETYGFDCVGPYKRVAYCKMKVPADNATPEEIERIHKENVATYLKYADPRNKGTLLKQDFEYCMNFDYKKLLNATPEEAADMLLKDPNIDVMFNVNSMFEFKGGAYKDEELNAYTSMVISFIEEGANLQLDAQIAGSAIPTLLPEQITCMQSMKLAGNTKFIACLKEWCQKGVSGTYLSGFGSDEGFQDYTTKQNDTMTNDSKLKLKLMGEIMDKNGGKDFFYTTASYIKKDELHSLKGDIDTFVHVKMALKAYEELKNPDLSDDEKLTLNTHWGNGKSDLKLQTEKNPEKVKKAMEEYIKNAKFEFTKASREKVSSLIERIGGLHLTEIMMAEKRDFDNEKKLGHTTLAGEIKKLPENITTKADISDLARCYAVLRGRIDSRHWYDSIIHFFRVRKEDAQMTVLERKIEATKGGLKEFKDGYDSIPLVNKIEAVRKAEGFTEDTLADDSFIKNYYVKSERSLITHRAAPAVTTELEGRVDAYNKEDYESQMRQKALDEQLEKMYEEDPELKELVEKKYDHNEGMKENDEPVNEDINTNSNQGMKEKDDVINL